MIRKTFIAALLCGTAASFSTNAVAQELPEAQQQEPTEPDPSDATADAAIAAMTPTDDAQAKIELLEAQVEALQEALEGIKAQMTATTPSWKGAPLYEDKEAGWSFKPRGRIQWDAGYVGNPDDDPNGGLLTRNLGFNTRARRIRLGAEGTIPGGFGYKFEMDYANAAVGFGDVILTYAPKDKPYNFIVGNHETWNGLEQISSSRFLSFMERAAFDDAFVNTRRIGISAGLVNKAGDMRFNAGLFAAHSIDGTFDNDGWIGAARAVYSPLMGSNQLHLGANFQHREFQSNNGTTVASGSGQPSANNVARYRARPFSQTTDIRFVDTVNFAAEGDDIFGLEAAGIFKSLHIAAEGQYLTSRVGYDPGVLVTGGGDILTGLNAFSTATMVTPDDDPSFWGGYIEAGYYLTGETRGYKNGTWDRTKVLKPFSKGGWGAFQINGRLDYLNLNSSELENALTANYTSGVPTLANLLSRSQRGGKQLGLLASLVWIPEDYLRLYFQYSHAFVTGGPFADEVDGVTATTEDVSDIDYGVDFFGTRIQVDF